ncbi:MAG: GlsB/YeaQ/YmgE family stress response membrane protein [Fimbriimonadaceae bacterium]|nr:GlsB/YeaQ/YmgE family stress response membrane protein [Fimbriimonadaceae bacterium]
MVIFWWILVGFVAGVLAKLIMPGGDREPKGCIMTILLGIAGSMLVGFLMQLMGFQGQGGTIPTIFGATIGACILIFLFRKFWKTSG